MKLDIAWLQIAFGSAVMHFAEDDAFWVVLGLLWVILGAVNAWTAYKEERDAKRV